MKVAILLKVDVETPHCSAPTARGYCLFLTWESDLAVTHQTPEHTHLFACDS